MTYISPAVEGERGERGVKNTPHSKHSSVALSFIPRKAAIVAYKWRVPSLVEHGHPPTPRTKTPPKTWQEYFLGYDFFLNVKA